MSRTISKMIVLWVCAVFVVIAACGGGSKTKGGGAKGSAAKDSGQKAGGTAGGAKNMGTTMGDEYLGVPCDNTTEGLAWCDSVTEIAFCAGGTWYLLDCAAPEIGGDFCGDDGETIDCYAASEF